MCTAKLQRHLATRTRMQTAYRRLAVCAPLSCLFATWTRTYGRLHPTRMVMRLDYAQSPVTIAAEVKLHTSMLQRTIEFSLAKFSPSSLELFVFSDGRRQGRARSYN